MKFEVVADTLDEDGAIRDGGAAEDDPDIVEALAAVGISGTADALEDADCLCRDLRSAPEIRGGGTKGMLIAAEGLRGTTRTVVLK